MRIDELEAELRSMKFSMDRLLKKSNFHEYSDLSGVDLDYTDPEQILLCNEFRTIMERMADITATLAILDAPVKYTGILSRRPDGRYGTEDGYYYTSGSQIEALVDNPASGDPAQWIMSSVEYDDDYYIVGYREIKLEGLTVRRRATTPSWF